MQHLNWVLAAEESYGSYSIYPVDEPDLSSPYSAIPRRQYDPSGTIELPDEGLSPPAPADLLTPARNPFVGASLEECGTYLRSSDRVDPPWDLEFFLVMDESYLTHGTLLVAHSFVAGDETRYYPYTFRCFRSGVLAYPSERGDALGHMSLRTSLDFVEDLERYQKICKSSGREDRSVGRAWSLFADTGIEEEEEDAESA